MTGAGVFHQLSEVDSTFVLTLIVIGAIVVACTITVQMGKTIRHRYEDPPVAALPPSDDEGPS